MFGVTCPHSKISVIRDHSSYQMKKVKIQMYISFVISKHTHFELYIYILIYSETSNTCIKANWKARRRYHKQRRRRQYDIGVKQSFIRDLFLAEFLSITLLGKIEYLSLRANNLFGHTQSFNISTLFISFVIVYTLTLLKKLHYRKNIPHFKFLFL